MGFLFYQAHRDKSKQFGGLKAGETRISTRIFDAEDCDALLRRSLMGPTELVENHDRSQFIEYCPLNRYLCVCLKLLKKQRDAVPSVIYTYQIKYERVCMLMKMV